MSFHRDGKKWEVPELESLINLYEQGCGWGRIATTLGRTVPACVVRLRAIRFYANVPKRLWNPRPIYQLQHLDHKGRE